MLVVVGWNYIFLNLFLVRNNLKLDTEKCPHLVEVYFYLMVINICISGAASTATVCYCECLVQGHLGQLLPSIFNT